MKEFIERGALYSKIVPLYKSANAFGSSRNVCKTWGKVLDMVQNAPAADVVEVVRCKDCKHRDGELGQPNIVCYQMHDDDFCSYGERRNDNAD